jgi:hypothetical protein
VLEKAREQVLIFRERDQAVAYVAWGKHVEVFAKAAGRTSVVGDGNDGGEFTYEAGRVFAAGINSGLRAGWGGSVSLETPQQRGKAGSASDGDDAKLSGCGHAFAFGVDGR